MNALKVPESAKLILFDSQDKIPFVAGRTDRLNLPGGGIKLGESPEEAAYRELTEEINLSESDIYDLHLIGGTWGPVTSSEGHHYTTRWHLFSGNIESDAEQCIGNEIQSSVGLILHEALDHPRVTDMAKRALRMFASI